MTQSSPPSQPLLWWQRGVVYQIYPRSYKDTSGNGIGDLQGIIEKLDYLNDGSAATGGTPGSGGSHPSAGIDAIRISPFYPSPMADFGYDVADYCDVNPLFGDLATFDRLVTESHRRGIKIIVDYVPNHSSDQHPWFIESRKGRDNPKRDWYIWRDPKPDAGGSYPSGPDLPPNDIFARQLHLYNEDQDEVHEIMRGFRRLLDEYGERCAIGELGIENGLIPPEKMQDPQGIRLGPERSRDVGRTPMQWDSSPHAGFSSAEPWLPVSADYATRNVAAQIADPHSILNLYRRLLWYRRQTPALQRGGYRAVDAGREGCFVYWREDAPGCFLIALNFTGAAARLSTPGGTIGQITLSTHLDRSESVSLSHLHLRPNEGVIIEAG